MPEPTAPRNTGRRSLTLDAAHEVIRALGLRGGDRDPPLEDADADSDLEMIPGTPRAARPRDPRRRRAACPPSVLRGSGATTPGKAGASGNTPDPAPMTGRCPGWGMARAALRYGVAQGCVLDETTRGSVNIQEAVNRVAQTGQAEVALHTWGRHGGPAEGIVVEPAGMMLVLAADMVRGVAQAACVRRARPQWTIQVYTSPRAWPFSTWAVLAVMWHLAPGGHPHRHRGGNCPGPPRLAGQPGLPLAQATGWPPSGARGGGVQPRGEPPATP